MLTTCTLFLIVFKPTQYVFTCKDVGYVVSEDFRLSKLPLGYEGDFYVEKKKGKTILTLKKDLK